MKIKKIYYYLFKNKVYKRAIYLNELKIRIEKRWKHFFSVNFNGKEYNFIDCPENRKHWQSYVENISLENYK